jgi:hypothetical protein
MSNQQRQSFVVQSQPSECYGPVHDELEIARIAFECSGKGRFGTFGISVAHRHRSQGIVQLGMVRMLGQSLLKQAESLRPVTRLLGRYCVSMPVFRGRTHLSRSHPTIAVRPMGANGGT